MIARGVRTAVMLALVGASGACTLIFGDYAVKHGTGGEAPGGAGGSASSSTSASSGSASSTTSSAGSSSSSGAPPAHCSNGKKDMGETGIDCGGGECPPCAIGSSCNAASDCANGLCFQGICCATDCSAPCMACGGLDTADPAGTCGPVLPGKTDPDNRCTKGPCDGNGACRCANGLQDGDETGIDCGGSCGKCLADACLADTDCASGHCVAGSQGNKVCCDQACTGTCMSCDQSSVAPTLVGHCLPVIVGGQGACPIGQGCSLQGLCTTGALYNGNCTADSQCISGFCYQGSHQCKPRNEPAGWPCSFPQHCLSLSCDMVTNLCQ